nr:RNA-binding protein [Lacticigenium naphthae]
MDMEEIYQHFRANERPFIDNVYDWVRICEDQYTPYLSNFLDPRQQFIVESIVGKNDNVKLFLYGGYEEAERKRAYIAPPYYEPSQDDYSITLLEIRYPIKFAHLSHGKILGSLLSLGMKRELFGDIITDGERWQFFLDRGMEPFIASQFQQVGKVNIQLEEKEYTDIIIPKDNWTTQENIVSSLRVDTVLSAAFHISRQKTKEMISSGKIKVNWVEMTQPDFELGILDVVSIRGRGRLLVKNINGKTKKEKVKLELGILDKNN